MLRSLLFLFLGASLLALVIGCDSSPKPALPPAPTLAPTVAAAQSPVATRFVDASAPASIIQTSHSIGLLPFVIHLPTAAPVFRPTTAEWRNQLAILTREEPELAAYLTALAEVPVGDEHVALAQLAPTEQPLTLIATVVRSDGLSLQTYLAATQAELVQSRLALGSGVVIEAAAIRHDLHQAHLPLATIRYTVDANSNTANGATVGYQAAMLDQSGNYLLLLTFVTKPAQKAAAQTLIETILARLQETSLEQ
jgi:hypothetical protein